MLSHKHTNTQIQKYTNTKTQLTSDVYTFWSRSILCFLAFAKEICFQEEYILLERKINIYRMFPYRKYGEWKERKIRLKLLKQNSSNSINVRWGGIAAASKENLFTAVQSVECALQRSLSYISWQSCWRIIQRIASQCWKGALMETLKENLERRWFWKLE